MAHSQMVVNMLYETITLSISEEVPNLPPHPQPLQLQQQPRLPLQLHTMGTITLHMGIRRQQQQQVGIVVVTEHIPPDKPRQGTITTQLPNKPPPPQQVTTRIRNTTPQRRRRRQLLRQLWGLARNSSIRTPPGHGRLINPRRRRHRGEPPPSLLHLSPGRRIIRRIMLVLRSKLRLREL